MNADIPTSICQWWTAAMPRTTDAAAALASLARHELPPEPKAPSDVDCTCRWSCCSAGAAVLTSGELGHSPTELRTENATGHLGATTSHLGATTTRPNTELREQMSGSLLRRRVRGSKMWSGQIDHG